MLSDSQVWVQVFMSVVIAVIYAVANHDEIFRECPTISCICGTNGYYEYVFLNTLSLISGLQFWKVAFDDIDMSESCCLLFHQIARFVASIGLIGLGVFPASVTDMSHITHTTFAIMFFAGGAWVLFVRGWASDSCLAKIRPFVALMLGIALVVLNGLSEYGSANGSPVNLNIAAATVEALFIFTVYSVALRLPCAPKSDYAVQN